MAKRTRVELDTQIATFETGSRENITALKFRNYETDLLDTLLPVMQDAIWFGLSDDDTPQGSEITIEGVAGVGTIPAFTDKYMLIARLDADPDIVSVVFSDDASQTNQIGAFTKHSGTVTISGQTGDFAVWVSNQELTQPAQATATVT